MSLALVQGYSSSEEIQERYSDSDSDGTYDENAAALVQDEKRTMLSITEDDANGSQLPQRSALPSAAHVFSEITGPPEYLKNSVDTVTPHSRPQSFTTHFSQKYNPKSQLLQVSRSHQKERPAGAIVEAKPQLVGICERVRSDKDTIKDETLKLPSAGLPSAEDVAQLLRMCLQCGVPKTYSAAKEGMMCPVCKDRPAVDMDNENSKKRGSKIKDKERSKRMKGQSSHATWKSETEMHLRQQFD